MTARALGPVALLVFPAPSLARAHVNSPHIYREEPAGPYPAVLIVHMPPAVPGEAEVLVRLLDRRPDENVDVWVREIPPQGESRAPGWVRAEPFDEDPSFFRAPVSVMVFGLWQRRFGCTGRGERAA